jgi:hypothetical protein
VPHLQSDILSRGGGRVLSDLSRLFGVLVGRAYGRWWTGNDPVSHPPFGVEVDTILGRLMSRIPYSPRDTEGERAPLEPLCLLSLSNPLGSTLIVCASVLPCFIGVCGDVGRKNEVMGAFSCHFAWY